VATVQAVPKDVRADSNYTLLTGSVTGIAIDERGRTEVVLVRRWRT
jgi:hypothetical protein